MEFFSDEVMRGLLASSLETAALDASGFRDVGKGPGSAEGDFIDWLTIKDNGQCRLRLQPHFRSGCRRCSVRPLDSAAWRKYLASLSC